MKKNNPAEKYRSFAPVALPDRRWPMRTIDSSPRWCSVDLRDGNQALIEPMGVERKLRLWNQLVAMGFKEIEVGFPSASQTEFDFVRELIERDLIPEDVTVQVLTQARENLIERTFEALRGARKAVVHLYNSTSALQRRVVFRLGRKGVREIAVRGVEQVARQRDDLSGTQIVLEYSPESFSGTELDFSVEVCEAVMDVWRPTPSDRLILNLPATVEMSTPNIYADQIEWFGQNLSRRESAILSVHPHNDRGTAVAAAELALMAGAERVEGTLFGNGERTGNVDLVTLALNLYSQGIDPKLDLSNMSEIVKVAQFCNRLPVHPRHPYAGELVFTAFSGSHQDAIKKGFAARRALDSMLWEVPYLPIDPSDIGRNYEAVIRINSQSGKGGVAYVLEHDHGLVLPRGLQREFSTVIQERTDASGEELSSKALREIFEAEYLFEKGEYRILDYRLDRPTDAPQRCIVEARIEERRCERVIRGEGNGPLDAFAHALARECGLAFEFEGFCEHALGHGADAKAIAYVEVSTPGGQSRFGAGCASSIVMASFEALLSALNRSRRAEQEMP